MDKSIVAVEESHWVNDTPASASMSLGSLVQIDSIAIDLSCAMQETESPLHEHFSIRGFVAGMREKDWKACLPFASQHINEGLVDNLPPLSVPKFRWWQCSNCVPDTAADSTAFKMLFTDRSDAGPSSCQRVGEGNDVFFSHGIRNIGDGHGSRESTGGVYNEPISKRTGANPFYKGHEASTSSKNETGAKNNDCGPSSAYIAEAYPVRIGVRDDHNADASDTVRILENTSVGIDEPENLSSGSDEAVCALPRRRKPKLRSLADIMEEENNSTSEHIKMRFALSSGMQVTSTEKEDEHCLPEPEVSADVMTVTRNPHRKRKIAAEEDRGPPHATNPLRTVKRFKGPIPDSEKRRRILEVSDSESGGDSSEQSELQLSAKTQQIKHRKNRKMKQTHSGNRTVTVREGPKIGSALPGSLQKHDASVETSFCNTEHVPPSPRGEMEPYLSSLIPGKQVDRISDKSKSTRPEVEVNLSSHVPPRKSFIGDCNVQGKLALDLSLNSYTDAERNSNKQISCRQHRIIPDLNESFTEKPSTSQWKQFVTSEDRCSAMCKSLDMATSCSEQTSGEGRRQFGVSEPQAVQKIHNNVESGGNSDGIPMDIVELLAKNQRDRTLDNSRNHLLSSTTNTSIRGSPTVSVDGHPGAINFPLSNARSGISVPSETEICQGILSFPRVQNHPLDNGNVEENQFRILSSFKPCQPKKTQFSASNSLFSVQRTSEGADLLWPPRRKNVPFHLDVRENHIRQNGLDMQSFPDQSYKGKTISDMKGVGKKAAYDASAAKEGRIGSSTKSTGSLDAYSNDTIPAMQLLSLMDRGIVAGSSFKVGSNGYLDKPFSACNHHPRLNVNEKRRDPFPNGSFFSQGSHSKDFPALLNGVRYLGESSKKSYSQGHMPPPQGNTKAFTLDGPDNLATQPSGGNLELEVCSLNRNPADFSIPDAKNEYTISARDLKSRKRKSPKEIYRCLEGQKGGRVRKDASGKECPRN